ncbi:MAG TPA: response regulator transcription factor [Pseudacidobacterium sp.]|jgi:DNA-binding NarL/FixJ family response regulator|nr:response regulator transcription factor [Pseudacidobacterium sp.]
MSKPVRILLVDDHALFRESLARLLEAESGFQVAGHCSTLSQARRILEDTAVDVILLDYDLGEEVGTDLLQELRRRGDAAKALMLTAGMRDSVTKQALNTGISGIIFKHSGPGQLIDAIHRVAKGEMWLDSEVVRSLVAGTNDQHNPHQNLRPLTDRQREVLRNILDGLTNKEIAWKMQASESSIKAVIQELFHKAGVRTRSQLVRIAIEKHSADWLDAK